MTTVEDWFGDAFNELHPLLQQLHRDGGVLEGQVLLAFGHGAAGLVGRRIARRLGLPLDEGSHPLQVTIRSTDGVLHWTRRFGERGEFRSQFVPFGRFPHGYWEEHSGPLRLRLGVRIHNGGWHWQHRGSRMGPFAFPSVLLPQTTAFKEAADGRYRFSVAVSVPLLGHVLGYSGTLARSGFAM